MRTLTIGLMVAAAAALATPASAQEFYLGVPGAGVHVGQPGYYHDGPRYRDDRPHYRDDGVRYRDERPRYRSNDYDRRDRTSGYNSREQGCRTVTIRRDDGRMTKVRRCD